MILTAICLAAAVYQIVALVACIRHLLRRDPASAFAPPVSILKPLYGADPGFYDAISSFASQDYPEFELRFCAAAENDSSVPHVRRLQREFPGRRIEMIFGNTQAPNGKVGRLIDAVRDASHGFLFVSDSDITAPPGYLEQVVAPLIDPSVGLVTCLYRARANTFAGKLEALGIATDFAPSALVAPMAGVNEFGLGSTLALRRDVLHRIGGFESIAAFLADDYQLGKRISAQGLRVHLSRTVVETTLQAATFRDVWRHQVRWHRTIRVSRGAYVGLPVTFATCWALVALIAGHPALAAGVLAARMAMALVAGLGVLRCSITARYFPLIPLRDLLGAAVWAAGLTGRTVEWRGQQLRLGPGGRIVSN